MWLKYFWKCKNCILICIYKKLNFLIHSVLLLIQRMFLSPIAFYRKHHDKLISSYYTNSWMYTVLGMKCLYFVWILGNIVPSRAKQRKINFIKNFTHPKYTKLYAIYSPFQDSKLQALVKHHHLAGCVSHW